MTSDIFLQITTLGGNLKSIGIQSLSLNTNLFAIITIKISGHWSLVNKNKTNLEDYDHY